MKNFRMLTLATLAFVAATGVAPAQAATAGAYKFSVNKTELATSAGLRRTIKHIEKFADGHCGVFNRQSLSLKRAAQKCAAELSDEIVAKIDNPQLTARHVDSVRFTRR